MIDIGQCAYPKENLFVINIGEINPKPQICNLNPELSSWET